MLCLAGTTRLSSSLVLLVRGSASPSLFRLRSWHFCMTVCLVNLAFAVLLTLLIALFLCWASIFFFRCFLLLERPLLDVRFRSACPLFGPPPLTLVNEYFLPARQKIPRRFSIICFIFPALPMRRRAGTPRPFFSPFPVVTLRRLLARQRQVLY